MSIAAERILPSPCIHPISDVRTRLPMIEQEAHEGRQVVLNRNGEPALVVLGYDEYMQEKELERHRAKIREAEIWERAGSGLRTSLADVRSLLKVDKAVIIAAAEGRVDA